MSEPVVHWNILPEYLELYLFKWNQDNLPTPFLRRGKSALSGTTHRASWRLTELGKADLENWKARPK